LLTLDLKVSVNENEEFFVSVSNKKEKIEKQLEVEDENFYFLDTQIVECSYLPEKDSFKFIKHRVDKSNPNFPFHYYQLKKNIERNFDFSAFKSLFSSGNKNKSFSSSQKITVFVTNLQKNINETHLKNHFSKFSPISIKILPDKKNNRKSVAFVNFKSEKDRDGSLTLNNSLLSNCSIRVSVLRDKNTSTNKWEKK
jgi:hypothetical protein